MSSRAEAGHSPLASASVARSPPLGVGQVGFIAKGPRGYAAAGWSGSTWRFQVMASAPSWNHRHPAHSTRLRPLPDGLLEIKNAMDLTT